MRVLFVGEGTRIVAQLRDAAGWSCDTSDWQSALDVFESSQPALTVLRLGGNADAVRIASHVCEALRLRSSDVGLVVLAMPNTTGDRSTLFEAGADHILTEPCSGREILACAAALFRRAGAPPFPRLPADDAATIVAARRVSGRHGDASFTKTERKLLDILLQAGPEGTSVAMLARDAFLRKDRAAANLVHRHIANLRKKLVAAGLDGVVVRSQGGYVVAKNAPLR